MIAAMEGDRSGNLCTATRFEYAKNGRTVTYVIGEEWQWDGDPDNCPSAYLRTYAREFRYDGARERYLNREVDTYWFDPVDDEGVWSDYDGERVYGDYQVSGTTVTNVRSFELGVGVVEDPEGTPAARYYHTDHLGTTRFMTDATGSDVDSVTYSAFGERIDGPTHRYGYRGTSGIEGHYFNETRNAESLFPFLHVGGAYYDPASPKTSERRLVSSARRGPAGSSVDHPARQECRYRSAGLFSCQAHTSYLLGAYANRDFHTPAS